MLGAVGAVGVTVFGLLVAQDSLNHASFAPLHLGGLAGSLLVAAYGGFLDRARSAWFGWLSYGAMLPAAIVVLGFGVACLRTSIFAKTYPGAFLVGLLVLAMSFPATLVARRRAKSRLPLVQSNNSRRAP
jgi:hypothetical protein